MINTKISQIIYLYPLRLLTGEAFYLKLVAYKTVKYNSDRNHIDNTSTVVDHKGDIISYFLKCFLGGKKGVI